MEIPQPLPMRLATCRSHVLHASPKRVEHKLRKKNVVWLRQPVDRCRRWLMMDLSWCARCIERDRVCRRHDSMANTAYLAVLHFFRWTLLRWFTMAEVLKVGVLRSYLGFFTLPSLLVNLFHPVIELLARIVSRSFGLLFLRSLGSVYFRWKIWLKGCRCLLIRSLSIGESAYQQQHD